MQRAVSKVLCSVLEPDFETVIIGVCRGTPEAEVRHRLSGRFAMKVANLQVSRLTVKIVEVFIFAAVVIVLLFWLVGGLRTRIRPDQTTPISRTEVEGETVEARLVALPRIETAVGTIQPVHRVELASRILARIVEVNVVAGQKVVEGEVLFRLDDSDLKSRVKQAQAVLDQATATRDQARIDEARIRALFETNAASKTELDRAITDLKTSEATVVRAQEALDEARAFLSFATIPSPITGVVIDKRANVGDMAVPGLVLATLLDPGRMQLVASVRETLSRRLKVGQPIEVKIDVLDHVCTGTISEIVPEADPASRSFGVKVTGPCPEGVYAGMFGRLLIPLDTESVLVIPRRAVRSVGQLDTVMVRTSRGDERRVLRLGRFLGDDVEVLAGLAAGERVVVVSLSAGHPANMKDVQSTISVP